MDVAQQTISFTSLRADKLLEDTLIDDLQKPSRKRRIGDFLEQLVLSKRRFEALFDRSNEQIITRLGELIDNATNREGHLFETNQIQAAILQLDMRAFDHEPTFDSIEQFVKKKKKFNVVRIIPKLIRKRGLLDLLEPSKNHKKVFVIVEQTETFNSSLTDQLLTHFRNRLDSESLPTRDVFVLFCKSQGTTDMSLDIVYNFPTIPVIKVDVDLVGLDLLENLLRNECSPYRLRPSALNILYDCYVQCDPSFSHLELFYNFLMFEHYTLPTNNQSPTNTKIEEALEYHSFICDQIYYYFDLLTDRDRWPEYVTDLYEELFACEELGHSLRFTDAVRDIAKFGRESLLKRIQRVEERSKRRPPKSRVNDVSRILLDYRDEDDNVTDLIEQLLKQAQTMVNPLRKGYDKIYAQTSVQSFHRIIRYLRSSKTLNQNYSDHFKILLERIETSEGLISANDLYTSFKGIKSSKEEGLVKALYVDILDNMEQVNLIKYDRKKGMIRRLVWHCA